MSQSQLGHQNAARDGHTKAVQWINVHPWRGDDLRPLQLEADDSMDAQVISRLPLDD